MEAVHIKRTESYIHTRAVAMSENLWGHIVLGEDNVPPLVEIGLFYLPKSGGARAPRPPRLLHACSVNSFSGNYSFLNLTLCTGAETIQRRKLFAEIR